MTKKVVTGSKGGGGSAYTPKEQKDNLISINKIKVLLAVADGEIDPSFSMKDLYLDDTPVQNQDGSWNYEGVVAEMRPGTQTQEYIKGFTETSTELTVGTTIRQPNPVVLPVIQDKYLSSIRFKIATSRMVKTTSKGDRVGTIVTFAFEAAVDGGSFVEIERHTWDGKNTSGYDQSYRVNMPNFNSQVLFRVRRITADSTSDMIVDEIRLQSYALGVDAKFRYPLTGLLYIEFDSEMFQSNMPSISVRKKWKIIKVPTNYNPETREFVGNWNGLFKNAWSNNPAFVLYDIITNQRYGLDQKELGIELDKWAIYEAGVHCDELVPDGKGGTEPRYMCDVVIQSQVEAYRLIRDICSIFRGMSFWNGESLSIVVDRRRNPSYVFTNDNVVSGSFSYTFASDKSMYTTCDVTFDDEENLYSQDTEGVFDVEASVRFNYNPTSITAIGCTRRSEANRRGRWILKTNLKSTTVNFATGLEGMIPTIGDVISVQDAAWATNYGLNLAGRVMEVAGLQVFTHFATDARAGDSIVINKPDGAPQRRTIASVSSDLKTLVLNVGFDFQPDQGAVFAIDRTDLALQQYVVTNINKGDGDDEFTYSITAVEYDPSKYDAIDYGVNVDNRPTSNVLPNALAAPENVAIDSYSRVVQGMSVETMVVTWDKVPYASYYDVQWRKDNGIWQNVPRTASQEVEVEGIYQGSYFVRVRTVSAIGSASDWSTIVGKDLTGKVGMPAAPNVITASTNEVFGIRVKWGMPAGSDDTAYIELQQSPDGTEDNASLLSMVPYPQYEYWHSILPAGQVVFYRVRSVDRIGNTSNWTTFVRGMATQDADAIGAVVLADIENTPAFKEMKEGALNQAAKAKATAEAIIQAALAGDADTKQLKKESGQRRAQYTQTVRLIADETQARTTAITQLEATIKDDVQASITRIDDALADETQARAQAVTALNSRVGDTETALTQKLDTYVDATGAGTSYAVNLGLRYNGIEYKAGMSMSLIADAVTGSIKSQMLFDADRFAILRSATSGTYVLPFLVENDQVIINSAVIKDGSITNAMIGDYIQSNNFQMNVQGWQWNKSGTFYNFGTGVGGSMKQTNDQITVRDAAGRVRVQIGRITGTW